MALSNPHEPTHVRNMDVVGIVERLDRASFDVMEFESASLNEVTEYDLARIRQYNAVLRTYASVVNSATNMDLPHSYPHMYEIKYITTDLNFDNVKNKVLRDVVRLYANAWVQWSRSESADRSNGWMPSDYDRFIIIMDRLDSYLTEYAAQALPIDLPHSTTFEMESLGKRA